MPTASRPYLSVIIPAYNEEARLGRCLKVVIGYLQSHYPSHELIVVDDGSSDATAQVVAAAIAHEPLARLITYKPNRGKGYAVRTGVLASSGEAVLFMDADLSTPLDEIPKIVAMLDDWGIAIGSRGKLRSKVQKKPPLFRQFASVVFDQIRFIMVGLRQFSDTQCGFKAFRGEIARDLFSRSQIDRFMFDAEILYLAEKRKYKIVEVPVSWTDVSESKVRFWEGLINVFYDLWRIRRIHP